MHLDVYAGVTIKTKTCPVGHLKPVCTPTLHLLVTASQILAGSHKPPTVEGDLQQTSRLLLAANKGAHTKTEYLQTFIFNLRRTAGKAFKYSICFQKLSKYYNLGLGFENLVEKPSSSLVLAGELGGREGGERTFA